MSRLVLNNLRNDIDSKRNSAKGPFNNYVDKMWGVGGPGEGGQKMSVFVHAKGIKTVHTGVGGSKMAKFCPRSC